LATVTFTYYSLYANQLVIEQPLAGLLPLQSNSASKDTRIHSITRKTGQPRPT